MNPTITAVVIAKNEEQMIVNCIDSLCWCNEVLVIDHGSQDNTRNLAKQAGVQVHTLEHASLIELRNKGLELSQHDWILYVDADERVTPKLAHEILDQIAHTSYVAFALPRNNIHYGKWMKHGGWEKDDVVRLFARKKLKHWAGEIHEHAVVEGETGTLTQALVHLTHRDLISGLHKSADWTPIEATLLFQANHPKMSVLRFTKVMLVEFLKRYILKKGFRDGVEGYIEAVVQAVNRFFVYEQLWELQRKPDLKKTYTHIEQEIAQLWKNEKR